MPTPEWPTWDRFKTALYCLAYREGPNLEVAAKAVHADSKTISSHLEKAGVPRKKAKHKGEMPPPPPEMLHLLEVMEARAGIAPAGNPSAAAPASVAPSAHAAPESVSISLPLEGDAAAMQKLAGLHPNLQVTVTGRLRVEG